MENIKNQVEKETWNQKIKQKAMTRIVPMNPPRIHPFKSMSASLTPITKSPQRFRNQLLRQIKYPFLGLRHQSEVRFRKMLVQKNTRVLRHSVPSPGVHTQIWWTPHFRGEQKEVMWCLREIPLFRIFKKCRKLKLYVSFGSRKILKMLDFAAFVGSRNCKWVIFR